MSTFDSIRSLVPKRSRRTLRDYRVFDFNIGDLIPIEARDCVPGDNLRIGLNALMRMKPLVAPVLGELDLFAYYFFVPYRILDPNFEDGITGGEDGTFEYAFPTLKSKFFERRPTSFTDLSLMDMLGYPVFNAGSVTARVDSGVSAYLPMAYHKIYNDFFRVEEFEEKVSMEIIDYIANNNNLNYCHHVSHFRDYFTSALKSQQKGIAPAFPISGFLPLITGDKSANSIIGYTQQSGAKAIVSSLGEYMSASSPVQFTSSTTTDAFNSLGVNLGSASTFDVSELRTVVQIQKILERANRTGSRYTEYLRSFFTVSPKDSRLQRPEFIGGTRLPVIINEVLQTSSTTGNPKEGTENTPQGTMTGHGITMANNYIGKYFVEEYGVLMGVMFARPRVMYSQGLNRQFLKKSRYDFYLPQLCNLSEQGVLNKEIYFDPNNSDNKNDEIFGFQGRWNEMRSGTSFVNGLMRERYSYWHFGRWFNSRPNLNKSFLECKPSDFLKIFAVQSEPGLIAECCTVLDAVRPITAYPEPGRLDHDM